MCIMYQHSFIKVICFQLNITISCLNAISLAHFSCSIFFHLCLDLICFNSMYLILFEFQLSCLMMTLSLYKSHDSSDIDHIECFLLCNNLTAQ